MRASEATPNGTPRPPKQPSTVVLLLGTIADTTWRMFVPIVGLLLLGLFIDNQLDTLPWGFIAGTIIGIAIAAALIKRQLKNVNQ